VSKTVETVKTVTAWWWWGAIKSVEKVKKSVSWVDVGNRECCRLPWWAQELSFISPASDRICFVTNLFLVLGTVKLLLPKERSHRWTEVLLTGVSTSLMYRGQRQFWAIYISNATLNFMMWTTGSHCSSRSAGPTWSHAYSPITSRAAAFCTHCSGARDDHGRPTRKELQ